MRVRTNQQHDKDPDGKKQKSRCCKWRLRAMTDGARVASTGQTIIVNTPAIAISSSCLPCVLVERLYRNGVSPDGEDLELGSPEVRTLDYEHMALVEEPVERTAACRRSWRAHPNCSWGGVARHDFGVGQLLLVALVPHVEEQCIVQ